MSYSLDFRRHVLKIKGEKKLTAKATGAQFGVSSRTIQRWEVRIEEKVKRETGARKLDMEALKEDLKSSPDSYLEERGERFGVRGSTIHYAIKRLGYTRKKKL